MYDKTVTNSFYNYQKACNEEYYRNNSRAYLFYIIRVPLKIIVARMMFLNRRNFIHLKNSV